MMYLGKMFLDTLTVVCLDQDEGGGDDVEDWLDDHVGDQAPPLALTQPAINQSICVDQSEVFTYLMAITIRGNSSIKQPARMMQWIIRGLVKQSGSRVVIILCVT